MRRDLLALGVVLVIAATGCGAGKNSSVPGSVRAALTQVDAAVHAHDYARTRSELDTLVVRTIAARDASQLSADQADRVLAAAAQLRADLPAAPPANPAPAPTAQPTQTSNGDTGRSDGSGGDGKQNKEHGGKDRKGSGKGPDNG